MHNNIHNLRQRHLLKKLKTPYTSWWHHRLSWGCRQTNSNLFYFFHKKCPKHFTYLQRGGQGRTSNRIEKSINCWKKGCRGIIILCNDLREIILPCSSHSSLVVWKTLPQKLKWNLQLILSPFLFSLSAFLPQSTSIVIKPWSWIKFRFPNLIWGYYI